MATQKSKKEDSLVILSKIIPHDGKEPFADLRQVVLDLKSSIDKSRWEMAAALYEIKDKGIHQRWGYSEFDQYIATEVQWTPRMAFYLCAMFEYFTLEVAKKLSPENVEKMIEGLRKIGWTKAKCLVNVATSDDVFDWIEKASNMSSIDLQNLTRKYLVEKGGGDSDAIKNSVHMSITFVDDQDIPVKEALKLAGEIANSDKKGHLFSLICMDYVASNMAQKGEGQKNRGKYFDRIGAQFGVKIVAVDRETGKVIHGKSVLKQIVVD